MVSPAVFGRGRDGTAAGGVVAVAGGDVRVTGVRGGVGVGVGVGHAPQMCGGTVGTGGGVGIWAATGPASAAASAADDRSAMDHRLVLPSPDRSEIWDIPSPP